MGKNTNRHSRFSISGAVQSFYRRNICLSNTSHGHKKKKSRKLGDLKLHTTFGLHFGDKFYPSFDKNSFQRTSLEQHSYRVSNMPFHSNGHTGIFLSKKSIKAGTSLTEQEAEKETKLVNVNYMYILYKNCHSLAS